MKLLFKQRFFSWFDSYDIYDENGNTVYAVKGQPSWGHKLQIYDAAGANVGTVKEVIFSWLPRFELYENDVFIGYLRSKFTFFKPVFELDFNGWTVDGNFTGWNYAVRSADGGTVAEISKRIFRLTDTYVIDVANPADALYALMLTLAIDAEKCSGR